MPRSVVKRRAEMAESSVWVARHFDLLAIAWAVKTLTRRRDVRLVYECLDIHGPFTKPGPVGRACDLERILLRRGATKTAGRPTNIPIGMRAARIYRRRIAASNQRFVWRNEFRWFTAGRLRGIGTLWIACHALPVRTAGNCQALAGERPQRHELRHACGPQQPKWDWLVLIRRYRDPCADGTGCFGRAGRVLRSAPELHSFNILTFSGAPRWGRSSAARAPGFPGHFPLRGTQGRSVIVAPSARRQSTGHKAAMEPRTSARPVWPGHQFCAGWRDAPADHPHIARSNPRIPHQCQGALRKCLRRASLPARLRR